MPAYQPTWTDERVERLKNRFAAGLSCREIACDIGVSRNAVIGKLSRLNLTRETGGEARVPAKKDAANGRRPRSVPRLQLQPSPDPRPTMRRSTAKAAARCSN